MIGDDMRAGGFDVLAGLGLLTRLPIRIDGARAAARGARAAWAWPLAGIVVGAVGSLAASLCLGLGLSAGVSAAVVLASQIMLTGALHEDGLADSADGLWGGWDRARRLEIMKDSRIGTYGVLALGLSLILRWSAIAAILAAGPHWAALVAAGALSRAPMAAVMAALPNARGSGLSQGVGRPSWQIAGLGCLIALGIGLACLGLFALTAALAAALAALCACLVSRRKIGGQTGDILGAVQQLAECAILAVLAARLGT